jgi:uncharacterized protein YjbI with pentapeptide repeats
METWPWVVLAAFGLLVVAVLPVLQVRRLAKSCDLTPDKRFKMENDARTTVAQIVGGLAILGGLVYTGQQFQLAQKTESGDRYVQALGHVADESPLSGQGSVLLLQTVAADSKIYSWEIMDLVATYAEKHAPVESAIEHVTGCDGLDGASNDIQAVIDTIGLRRTDYDRPNWFPDLSDANLQGAWFRGYTFDNVGLERDRLECADFTGAHLAGANLQKSNLEYATLSGADLRRASLQNADLEHAHLDNAHLDGAHLDNALLDGAFLAGTTLRGTDLSKVVGLKREQVGSAIGDGDTKLPPYLK